MGILRHRRNRYGGKDGRKQASRGAADGAHHRFSLRFVNPLAQKDRADIRVNEHPSGSTNVNQGKSRPHTASLPDLHPPAPARQSSRRTAGRSTPYRLTTGTTWRLNHPGRRAYRQAGIVAQARPWRFRGAWCIRARPSAKADRARGILFASSGTELDQSMQTGTERAGRPASSNPPVRLTVGHLRGGACPPSGRRRAVRLPCPQGAGPLRCRGVHARRVPEGGPRVSAPGMALLTRIDDGALGRVSSEGVGVEPGGQQSFDLGE